MYEAVQHPITATEALADTSQTNLATPEDASTKDIEGDDLAPTPRHLDNAPHVVPDSPKRLKRYSLAFALTTFGVRTSYPHCLQLPHAVLADSKYGPAFGSIGTYFTYQLQQIGFLIGVSHIQPCGCGIKLIYISRIQDSQLD